MLQFINAGKCDAVFICHGFVEKRLSLKLQLIKLDNTDYLYNYLSVYLAIPFIYLFFCSLVYFHFSVVQIESGGVYGEEEKKFVFNNVIVGRKAKARFKISNTTKVRPLTQTVDFSLTLPIKTCSSQTKFTTSV